METDQQTLTNKLEPAQSESPVASQSNSSNSMGQRAPRKAAKRYRLSWVLRAVVTVVGATLYTLFYAAIVFVYLRRTGQNGVSGTPYPVDARVLAGICFISCVSSCWILVALARSMRDRGLDLRLPSACDDGEATLACREVLVYCYWPA